MIVRQAEAAAVIGELFAGHRCTLTRGRHAERQLGACPVLCYGGSLKRKSIAGIPSGLKSGLKGRCAICGVVGKLTEDHVPPRLVVPPDRIIIDRFARELGEKSEGDTAYPGFSSLVFPTICRACRRRQARQLLRSGVGEVLQRIRHVGTSRTSVASKPSEPRPYRNPACAGRPRCRSGIYSLQRERRTSATRYSMACCRMRCVSTSCLPSWSCRSRSDW